MVGSDMSSGERMAAAAAPYVTWTGRYLGTGPGGLDQVPTAARCTAVKCPPASAASQRQLMPGGDQHSDKTPPRSAATKPNTAAWRAQDTMAMFGWRQLSLGDRTCVTRYYRWYQRPDLPARHSWRGTKRPPSERTSAGVTAALEEVWRRTTSSRPCCRRGLATLSTQYTA